MPKLVEPYQSSFVIGRLSINNIIVAQEIIHLMRSIKGRKGFMRSRLTEKKTYNRLKWAFIHDTLKDIGINDYLVELIMKCIQIAFMQALWYGYPIEAFKPSREVRQEDPLYPYLLCYIWRVYHNL